PRPINFHNNFFCLNRNLENLQTLLHELDFNFNIVGVTETNVTYPYPQIFIARIPGYIFEYVPTPLTCVLHFYKVNKTINKHAPRKTISNCIKAKKLSKPWITKTYEYPLESKISFMHLVK
ncbi:hypothetical protein pdam_00017726, partial [Pocillopora damicornis]